MRATLTHLFLLFLGYTTISAQNLLSPEWSIRDHVTTEITEHSASLEDWKPINLLLSWERQGYSWMNGRCRLQNEFQIPSILVGENLQLSFSLQCDVEKVFVNSHLVSGAVGNSFWTERGSRTLIPVPAEMLKANAKNQIQFIVSNLSYTGGISHNVCELNPVHHDDYRQFVEIIVPAKDHVFKTDTAPPSILIRYQTPEAAKIFVEIHNDFHELVLSKEVRIGTGRNEIKLDLSSEIDVPGFYECKILLKGTRYSGDVAWFAVNPELLPCPDKAPKQFEEYWNSALSELALVEPEFKLRKDSELSKGYRDAYIAEMQSIGGLTIRAYYFVPRTPGKHKTILHLPGYSYGFDGGKPFVKEKGENIIEMALCVRGHGISADIFNPGFGIPGIWGYKLFSEEENAYRAIYMDCVRAIEFLQSRPEVDSDYICVMGGSQGGGLTLATAALCKESIRACAYFDPFVCDPREHFKIRTQCYREIQNFLDFYNNPCSFEEAMRIQDLIDTQWFAERINCPTFFATALFDDDSPPRLGFAAYNRIQAPKQYRVYPNDSHLGESNNGADMMAFLLAQ